MKKSFLFLLLMIPMLVFSQNVPTPEQFLGYSIGKAYTPHHKIVSYFKALAAARPDMIKLEKYGETYEGRELMLAYISSPSNVQNLENIRKNNLSLTGLNSGSATTQNTPSVVWLSYNVHGNETSSSEAA